MLEQLLMSLKVLFLGLVTVFVALALLIFLIELMHKAVNFKRGENKKQPSATDKAFQRVEKMEETRLAEEYNEEYNIEAESDEELIAVISAAVAAALNRSTHDIIVKSVRRISTHSPAWNRISRQEQIGTRF